MDDIVSHLQVVGPVFAILWILTIVLTVTKPQRFFNSFLLLLSLLVSLIFLAGFLREAAGFFLLACFLLVMLALLLVPLLLILNGVQMIRKESLSPAHVLSLGLGIVIGIGEIATAIWVLRIGGFDTGSMNGWILFISLTVFYFSFLVLSFVVYSVFIQIMPHRMNFNYVIIHGCGLADGERMTRLLSNRVDKAIEIYRRCRVKPIIIPSGGRGSDEKLSEAEAMRRYLLQHGIPDGQILMEDRSATTRENLQFSKMLIFSREGRKKTALVSSNYHIYRCLRIARDVGLPCTGIGAKVALYYWPSALIREFIAVFVNKKFLIWALIGYLVFLSPLLYLIFS